MKGLLCFVFLVLLNFSEVAASYNNTLANNNKNAALNYQQGQVNVVITAAEKNSHFNAKTKVNYKLFIKNGIPQNQEGTISYRERFC